MRGADKKVFFSALTRCQSSHQAGRFGGEKTPKKEVA